MMRIRRGYTLIESLVVIALTGATLTVATVTMHGLHRAEHRVRDDLQAQRAVEQVASQLRWDAHEARSAETVASADESKPRGLKLALADGRSISYTISANQLARVVRRGDALEHREDYRWSVPDGYWSIDASRERPLLSLHLVHPVAQPIGPSRDTKNPAIRAAVGILGAQAKKGGRDEKSP